MTESRKDTVTKSDSIRITDSAQEVAGNLSAGVCVYFEDHTPAPNGYIQWHYWAEGMAKTHKQRKCAGCGRYVVWEPKNARHIIQEQSHD